jgi:hypothetical protein
LHGFPEGLEGQFPDRTLITPDETTLAHTNDRNLFFHQNPPFPLHLALFLLGMGVKAIYNDK